MTRVDHHSDCDCAPTATIGRYVFVMRISRALTRSPLTRSQWNDSAPDRARIVAGLTGPTPQLPRPEIWAAPPARVRRYDTPRNYSGNSYRDRWSRSRSGELKEQVVGPSEAGVASSQIACPLQLASRLDSGCI